MGGPTSADEPSTVPDALRAVGHPGVEPPRRPVLRKGDATLVTLATLGADPRLVWHGLWLGPGSTRALGPAVAVSGVPGRATMPSPTGPLVDLITASSLSLLDRLEGIGVRLDTLEAAVEPPPLGELSGVQRELVLVRKHLFRLELLLAELDGPLARTFPGIDGARAELSVGFARSAQMAVGLQQSARDLLALRSAAEANRLADTANALGRTSNEIAALANTSNLRMLGVAYVALALALISAVVLIPNTGATILGMPSASWVPGLWVDVILVVLAIVPAVVVFSRGWVRRLLRGWGEFERRSAEGLAGLPEIAPEDAARPTEAERLIRPRP